MFSPLFSPPREIQSSLSIFAMGFCLLRPFFFNIFIGIKLLYNGVLVSAL